MADLIDHLWLIELQTRDRATLQPRLECWASSPGMMTIPGDDPPLRVYQPRIIDPGNTETHLFAAGATFGAPPAGMGEVRLNNADGGLDYLSGRMCDDGELVIRYGPIGGRYPADFPVQQRGRCRRRMGLGREISLTWVDMQTSVMDRLLLTDRYGGTNVLPAGVDGVAEDLAQAPKPRVHGDPGARLPLVCVNTARLIYQVSCRPVATLSDVQDKGVNIPIEATESTLVALEAATVTAGKARVYLGGGVEGAWVGAYVRLGSSPAGLVTARAAEADVTLSGVVRAMLTGAGGVLPANIDADSFAAVAASHPDAVGWFLSSVDAGTRVGEAVTALCDGAGIALTADLTGIWRLLPMVMPRGLSPVLVCDRSNILLDGLDLDLNRETDGVPASRILVEYDHNWAAVTADELAATVPADQANLATQAARVVTALPRADQPVHALAQPLTISTRLRSAAAAQVRADAARDFYCGQILYATIPLHVSQAAGVGLGSEILLRLPADPVSGAPARWPDLGIDVGRPLVVIGRADERRTGKTFLYCVG